MGKPSAERPGQTEKEKDPRDVIYRAASLPPALYLQRSY